MSESPVESEYNLKDLFLNVVGTRVPVLVGLIVVSILYWGGTASMNFVKPTVHNYEIRVDLTFSGVEEGLYPNGSPFRITDLISPVVLRRVYEANGLEAFIDRKDFVDAFNLAPHTPTRDFIVQKYAAQARGLQQAELDERQQQLARELEVMSRGSVAIAFTSSKASDVPVDLMMKVLRDVPQEWNRHRVEDVGVLRYDRPMFTAAVIDQKLIESVDYLIAFELVLDRIALLRDNLEAIRFYPNSSLTVDPETGLNVPDLDKVISDVENYMVTPLMNPVRSLGIARDPAVVSLYFQNLLDRLKRSRDVLTTKQSNIKVAYADYVATQNNGLSQRASGKASGAGTMIPQFGAEFIDRIVEMTNAGEDISYRQKLNTEQVDIANEVADIESEINRIGEILKAINAQSGAKDENIVLRNRYTGMLAKRLPEILPMLEDYFTISNRIMDQLSSRTLGTSGLLFRYADGNTDHVESGNIVNTENLRTYLVLMFLTIVVLVPLVMLRKLLR